MSFNSITPLDKPLDAVAVEGEVVLTSCAGHGRPVVVAMTPEAVLASLDIMRAAAEAAIVQAEETARLAATA
ncbi:MAG TPA: hypothetical protein VF699_11130 [Caulobacteraceae bacterium]|jgi:hypothetical protein